MALRDVPQARMACQRITLLYGVRLSASDKGMAMKWEYRICAPPSDCLEHWLNVLGDEGWEMCGHTFIGWVFKRDKARNWNNQ
jgi:hypothetical protein